MKQIVELIRSLAGQYNTLTIQRPYIKFTGSIEGGLLLSQIIYWSDRTNNEDGWFYKTFAAWEEEICIKQRAVSKFVQAWKEYGFLETKVKRIGDGTPVTHYRFLMDPFIEKLTEFLTIGCQERRLSRSAKSELAVVEKQVLTGLLDRSAETTSRIDKDDLADPLSQPYIHQIITSNTHIDPERVCEEKEKSPDPGRSVIVASEPESPPVFSGPIGGDTFAAAAPQKTSIEGFPIGPWGPSLFEIDAGFVGWMIAQWRKGDGRQSQTFGKMACEEVRACLQKYWKKDWSTLSIDWDAYSSNTQRLVEAVSDRMGRGIEISTQEQKLLNDRVKGPEHLRAQPLHSVPQQDPIDPVRVERGLPSGAVPLIAASELSESQIAEIKRSSEAARSNLVAPDQGLFVGRLPIAAFMLWLETEAQKHIIPGMSLRSIALGLGRRLEMQEAYLESVAQDF